MIKGLEKLVVTWSQLKYVDSQQKRIDQSTTTATMDDSHCLAIYRKLYAASIHIYAMNICVRCVFGFIHAPQHAIKPVKKRFMNIQYACFGFVVPDSCWCCSINFNLHLNWFISFFSHTCDFFYVRILSMEGGKYILEIRKSMIGMQKLCPSSKYYLNPRFFFGKLEIFGIKKATEKKMTVKLNRNGYQESKSKTRSHFFCSRCNLNVLCDGQSEHQWVLNVQLTE